MRYLVIPADSVFHRSRPLHLQDLDAAGLNEIVGGNFHVLPVPGDGWMYANLARVEEPEPENIVATALAHHTGGVSIAVYVTGPAVIVGDMEAMGVLPSDVPGDAVGYLRELGCTVT